MKTDYSLNLALNLKSLPGGYALLLGSGISKSAGIPTGWDIVLDLIKQLSILKGQSINTEQLEKWYKENYNEDADYSKILDMVGKTQTERMSIIKKFFEPNTIELEEGLKVPTKAHKAIASIVKKGYIRMIITTNFDRLLEKALEEEGITPDVISSDDDLNGVLPYIHSSCVIVKVHGDYLDTRIKNTVSELESYSESMNRYLERIFDEFGVIVCGWSASWDKALRNVIMGCPSRRFSTFWLNKGKLSEEANKIIHRRAANKIEIDGADQFFEELLEKIKSLEELEIQSPVNIDIAVATVKRYLVDEKYKIRLHDLIYEEIETVYQKIINMPTNPDTNEDYITEFQNQIKKYEAISEKLIKMLVIICYHGKENHYYLIKRAIERLGNIYNLSGMQMFIKIKKYVAFLILYSTGITALANKKYKLLNDLLFDIKINNFAYNTSNIALYELNSVMIFDGVLEILPIDNTMNSRVPGNSYMDIIMRSKLSFIFPGDEEHTQAFDKFELILSMVYYNEYTHLLPACYRWRNMYLRWNDCQLRKDIGVDFAKGNDSDLIKAGFFYSDINAYEKTLKFIDEALAKRGFGF